MGGISRGRDGGLPHPKEARDPRPVIRDPVVDGIAPTPRNPAQHPQRTPWPTAIPHRLDDRAGMEEDPPLFKQDRTFTVIRSQEPAPQGVRPGLRLEGDETQPRRALVVIKPTHARPAEIAGSVKEKDGRSDHVAIARRWQDAPRSGRGGCFRPAFPLHNAFAIIQIAIAIIIRFSVSEIAPRGTRLPPPTQAQLRSRFST